MQAGMESCPVKTVIAGTMGFGLGGAFGLFMASVSHTMCTPSLSTVSNTYLRSDVLRLPPHTPRP